MVNLPFFPSAIRCFDSPTHLNSNREEKLRNEKWLISAILREINQLKGTEQSGT
jgi:hypothetical protein